MSIFFIITKVIKNISIANGLNIELTFRPTHAIDNKVTIIFDILNNSLTFAFDTRVRLVKLNDHEL